MLGACELWVSGVMGIEVLVVGRVCDGVCCYVDE